MTDLNFESFNFADLAGDSNPFGEAKAGFVDNRFYKLTRDQEDRGAAVIRFLPDPEKKLIQRLYKINVNTQSPTGEKRWFNDWSPQNIGRTDPFQEHWSRLFQSGQKEKARAFARQTRYIANIMVVKDPANPENEGKIFLLDMSQSLKQIVEDALMPSKADQALGKQPAELFNPLSGNNFLLTCKKGANGFLTYENSAPVAEKTSVFATKEEAVDAIVNKCHKLSDFLKPEIYKSSEELQAKLDHVLFRVAEVKDTSEVQDVTGVVDPVIPADQVSPVVTTSPTTSAGSKSLDDILDSVM